MERTQGSDASLARIGAAAPAGGDHEHRAAPQLERHPRLRGRVAQDHDGCQLAWGGGDDVAVRSEHVLGALGREEEHTRKDLWANRVKAQVKTRDDTKI